MLVFVIMSVCKSAMGTCALCDVISLSQYVSTVAFVLILCFDLSLSHCLKASKMCSVFEINVAWTRCCYMFLKDFSILKLIYEIQHNQLL